MDDTPSPVRPRRWGKAVGFLAAGIVAGAIMASTMAAGAQTSGSSSGSSSTTTSSTSSESSETALTGTTAQKVRAAALAAVPGGTILRVETSRDGSSYEAHVRKADGAEVVVLMDKNFKVTSIDTHHCQDDSSA
jgi:hypothetical protein